MYHIVICDDNKLDQQIIWKLLLKNGLDADNTTCSFFSSGEAFLRNMPKEIDAVFMDIQMKGRDGYETVLEFRKRNLSAVLVFCSGAVELQNHFLKVNPFRFLQKGMELHQLDTEMQEIIEKIKSNKKVLKIPVFSDKECIYLRPEEVRYAMKRRYGSSLILQPDSAYYNPDKTYRMKEKLAELQVILKSSHFVQTHSSFLVNLQAIIRVEENLVWFDEKMNVPISRSYKKAFEKEMMEYCKWNAE